MRFFVDEQLPFLLADWLCEKGYDAIHVSTLLTGARVPDEFICQRSMAEQRVVITKDADFFKTYFLKRQPYKLIYLTTGNLKNRSLLDLFRANWSTLLSLLERHQVLELNRDVVRVWF